VRQRLRTDRANRRQPSVGDRLAANRELSPSEVNTGLAGCSAELGSRTWEGQ
jgi:hypothetical protein